MFHLQEDLNKIQTWCETRGFNINVLKTTGIVFTNKNKYSKPNLYIGDQKIKFEPTATFLGVKFDSRLNWAAHVDLIEEKIKPRLNIMRCISGFN